MTPARISAEYQALIIRRAGLVGVSPDEYLAAVLEVGADSILRAIAQGATDIADEVAERARENAEGFVLGIDPDAEE